MKRSLFIFLLLIVAVNTVIAQNSDFIEFPQVFSVKDAPLVRTHDNGYLFVHPNGSLSYSAGGFVMARLTESDSLLWVKVMSGYIHSAPIRTIIETKDHGFLLVGRYGNDYDGAFTSLWVTRVDSLGNLLWSKSIFNPDFPNVAFEGNDVVQLPSGVFLVTAYDHFAKNCLLRMDDSGNIEWSKSYSFSGGQPFSFEQMLFLNDHEMLVGGYLDGGLLKMDTSGNLIWAKAYTAATGGGHQVKMVQTSDGNVVIMAASNLSGYALLYKIDTAGTLIWDKKFLVEGSNDVRDMIEDDDGNLLVTGNYSLGGPFIGFLQSFHANGSFNWNTNVLLDSTDYGYVFHLLKNDDGLVFTGASSGAFVAKTDNNGESACLSNVGIDHSASSAQMSYIDYTIIIDSDFAVADSAETASSDFDPYHIYPCSQNELGMWYPFIIPETYCVDSAPIPVSVINWGNNTVDSFTIQWKIDGILQEPVKITAPLSPHTTGYYTTDTVFIPPGEHQLVFWPEQPNGVPDAFTGDDTLYRTRTVDSIPSVLALNYSDTVTICDGDTLHLEASDNPSYYYSWYKDGIYTGNFTNAIDATEAGIYYTSLSTGFCGTSSDSVTVVVDPGPNITFIYFYTDTIFSFPELQNVTYQWFYNDSAIAGATNDFYVPVQSGSYNLLAIDSFGCSKISYHLSVVFDGLHSLNDNVMFNVFPNPVSDVLLIQLYSAFSEKFTVEILSIEGRILKTLLVEHPDRGELTYPMDLTKLPDGPYEVRFTSQHFKATKKVMKIH